MWTTLLEAAAALKRDGWTYYTSYNFWKAVSGRRIWVELGWNADGRVVPMLNDAEDERWSSLQIGVYGDRQGSLT